MERSKALILIFTLFVLLAMSPQAKCGQNVSYSTDLNDLDTIIIALTTIDINDTNLELNWKIKNHTNHDVWILKNVDALKSGFEVFMDEDNQTLLIRRRLNVPTFIIWFVAPTGTYVRLRPDEELAETLSLALPIRQNWVFALPDSTPEYAKRLALEIGFYDKDLPGMIRSILEFAEKLDWREKFDVIVESHTQVIERYFKGLYLALDYGGLSGFNNNYFTDPNQVIINYREQLMTDEQILSATVNGVYIPIKGQQDATFQSKKEPGDLQLDDYISCTRKKKPYHMIMPQTKIAIAKPKPSNQSLTFDFAYSNWLIEQGIKKSVGAEFKPEN